MSNDDVYLNFQRELAGLIGCIPHPNDILQGIRDLKARAIVGDQKRNQRAQRISTELRNRLAYLGITEVELKLVDQKIDLIAEELAVNADPHIAESD